MVAMPVPRFTIEQYFAIEATQESRFEYFDGYVIAMAGASEIHNLLTSNVHGNLFGQLRSNPCRVFTNDLRVQVNDKSYFYPDVVGVCGERKFVTIKGLETLTNPTLIVEVLSNSTSSYDEDGKLPQYTLMPSLMDILIISQKAIDVRHHARQDNRRWLMTPYTSLEDVIFIGSVGASLRLSDIYENVDFS